MNREPLNPSSPFAVVVNDDPTQLNVLSGLVRKAGLESRTFTTAEAALADMSGCAGTAAGDPGALPALVVTDLYMPGIDGWRFCRLLRSPEYAAFNQVPILVVSATFVGDEADRIADDLGAEVFLSSPVDGKHFIEQVRAVLDGNRVRPPLHVLIVEDSRTLACVIKKAFAAHGYQADMALTARAASDAFAGIAYDVAVLDYHLPDGMGDALLDTFRAQRPDCVCLMMTTDTGPELALDWMKRGAAAYLKKPFQPDYLIELCARARRERSLLRVQDLLEVRTRELRESEEKHRILLDESSDPIFSFTPEGQYKYANRAFADGVGKPLEAIIGKRTWDIFPKEVKDMHFATLNQVFRTGKAQNIEVRFPLADGDRYYMATIAPIKSASGEVFSAICSAKDITGRKRAEEELLHIKETLEQRVALAVEKNMAQERMLIQQSRLAAMGEMIGNIAHQWRQPLNALGLVIANIEDAYRFNTLDEAYLGQAVADGRRLVQKMSSTISDFSNFFRPDKEIIDFSARERIEEAIALMGPSFRNSNISIHIDAPNDLKLLGFPNEYSQVLLNLLSNAKDAILANKQPHSGRVDILLSKEVGQGCVSVRDNGGGIPEAIRDRIFEPYFSTKKSGTGIGLYMSKMIIESNMNGGITARNIKGGAEFIITTPLAAGNGKQDVKKSGS